MHPDEIRALVRANPFRPFRLYVSDGTSYDIPHRDFIFVSRRSVVIGFPGSTSEGNGSADMPERFIIVATTHVTRLEPLEASAS